MSNELFYGTIGLMFGFAMILWLIFAALPDTLTISFDRQNERSVIKKIYGPLKRTEVESILSIMTTMTSVHGVLTVGDVYSIFNEPSDFVLDETYGWVGLEGYKIVRTRKGWELQLPPAQVLIH